MEEICKKIVEKLKAEKKTIAFMESCTGGFLANSVTNIEGASDVLKVSLVTYSSEYKEKFGVDKNIIEKYTVYSKETANEMAKKVSEFAKSDIGVGITGELNNTKNKEPRVYFSIYIKENEKMISNVAEVIGTTRLEMKKNVAKEVLKKIQEEAIV